MPKKKRESRVAETLSTALELPSGLLSGGAHMELRSNREAIIDGRCTVLEYDDNVIRINTGTGVIRFTGRGLEIRSLTADSAVISGFFCSLDFTD